MLRLGCKSDAASFRFFLFANRPNLPRARNWPLSRCLASFHQSSTRTTQHDTNGAQRQSELLKLWSKFRTEELPLDDAADGLVVGFLTRRRTVGKSLSFADLTTPSGTTIQICSRAADNVTTHAELNKIPLHSPVLVHAVKDTGTSQTSASDDGPSKTSLYLQRIQALNEFPKDIIVTPEVQFPPAKRHLQIRFHQELQARLRYRAWLKAALTYELQNKGFVDIETPTLFKSTPEGAREYLVPTRQRGKAYALTQSPQQYKQALMASGFTRYMQWARCYRDEDSRSDRQPEFTQLDLEWAFAGPEKVRNDVTDIIQRVQSKLHSASSYQDMRGERVPTGLVQDSKPSQSASATVYRNLTYTECITSFGSDKPDLRIPGKIHAIEDLTNIGQFVSMITRIQDPLIEMFTFSLVDCSVNRARAFVTKFMDNLPATFDNDQGDKPQILIYDSRKPLVGFSSIGHGYEEIIAQASEGKELQDGDLVVFHAREKPRRLYNLASTKIGELRSLLWHSLVEEGYMSPPPPLGEPGALEFVWVTEFPMFKPVEKGEPGQGGVAGITSAHHPFTAPLSRKDFELLFTDPLQAKSAGYDLVLNGVEVGGGSERNHIADVQEFIMRDVLKMDVERLRDFSHLFEVLRAGCPPHAGFALGFDRLVALMTGTSTVRDVIAFPKTMKGEDLFVRSPSTLHDEQLQPYGLQLRAKSGA